MFLRTPVILSLMSGIDVKHFNLGSFPLLGEADCNLQTNDIVSPPYLMFASERSARKVGETTFCKPRQSVLSK